jgi:apolipoprotein N-acyltransferase
MIALPGGFDAGTRRRTMMVGSAPPFAPLICYEIIFPGAAVGRGERPGWMVNVTNDAWFGDTPGPYQHLQQAVVRAVEEGLPLARAANSGISAIVDPYGRVVASRGVDVAGVVDGPLPAALGPTPYVRFGDTIFGALLLLSALAAAVASFTRTKRGN